MEKTEETTNASRTLLVRHLPTDLSKDEKEDLLKYFGAESVRVFPTRGRMKHAAFATFKNEKFAAKALTRLHQLEVLGHTLVAEFAKGQDRFTVLKDPPPKQPNIPLIDTGIASSLGLKFQANPTLKYLYPPPSNSILTNIAHAIISVPKFYVQVLHLMNKMNLPCPFGPVTARPPTVSKVYIHVLQPSDVFEQPQPGSSKKIEFNIVASETKLETGGPSAESQLKQQGKHLINIQPMPSENQDEDSDEEEEDVPKDVISRRELDKGRLSKDEIKRMSVFKNYNAGEPTCRLYVKNIAKQVEEKDLKYIYGRYIDPSSDAERNMFDIVLMKEGRMKGQAFVGLPSETSAQRALRDTNGYVLYDKPLVVVSFPPKIKRGHGAVC
uniref:RNA-binding region-containing protein 3 n=1 Tax=Neogobius melanostomus TaxID=47308 RepID=A0A8C6SYY4_9GOBI